MAPSKPDDVNGSHSRIVVPAWEALLGKQTRVLNHGFVTLVDYLGGDDLVINAARVSYGKKSKRLRGNRGLIHYLLENRHTSPFEQVVLVFHCCMPIFVARQWIRHRTARVNEMSGRYGELPERFFVVTADKIRLQNQANKQGSSGGMMKLDRAKYWAEVLDEAQRQSYQHYLQMVDDGMARELARTILPVSIYTEWYWQMDLHNLFHFLKLRMDTHAQPEIQVYGKAIADIVKVGVPMCWEAFENYILNAQIFSAQALRMLMANLVDQEKLNALRSRFRKANISARKGMAKKWNMTSRQMETLLFEKLV